MAGRQRPDASLSTIRRADWSRVRRSGSANSSTQPGTLILPRRWWRPHQLCQRRLNSLLSVEDRLDDVRRKQREAQDAGQIGWRNTLAIGQFSDGRILSRLKHAYPAESPRQCLDQSVVGLVLLDSSGWQVNRPRFTGGWFVQSLGEHIERVQVCMERLLCFCGRGVSNGAEKTAVVIPVDPFQRFPFNLAHRFPRADLVDHLGFEQANHAFGQGVVIGVTDCADREIDLGLGQALGAFDRQVL